MSTILLFWIGQQLQAPTWFWFLWGISAGAEIIQLGMAIYNAGKNNKK